MWHEAYYIFMHLNLLLEVNNLCVSQATYKITYNSWLCFVDILQQSPDLWSLIFTLLGVRWVLQDSSLIWKLGTAEQLGRRKINYKVAHLCLFWAVWKQNIVQHSRRGSLNIQKKKLNFVLNLWH